jgi:hypothetical protein
MTNNTYKFQPDQPAIIALKYRTGKPFTQGVYSGFTYTMGNGLIFRVPAEADQGIQALHLDAGMPFRVTKRTVAGKDFKWDIERLSGGPGENRPSEVTASDSSDVHHIASDDTTPLPIPPAVLLTEHGRDILRHLIGAIEIAHIAEQHAKKIGRIVHFTSNDIRSLAISCSIQQSHEMIEDNKILATQEPVIFRAPHPAVFCRAVSAGGNR